MRIGAFYFGYRPIIRARRVLTVQGLAVVVVAFAVAAGPVIVAWDYPR